MENFLVFFFGKNKHYVRDLGFFLGKKNGKFLCKKRTYVRDLGNFYVKKTYVRDLGISYVNKNPYVRDPGIFM